MSIMSIIISKVVKNKEHQTFYIYLIFTPKKLQVKFMDCSLLIIARFIGLVTHGP